MREWILDGAKMTSKEAMYAHFNRLFNLPSYFGNNLDALWDVLTQESEPTVIHFKNVKVLFDEMDEYGEQLLKLFQTLNDKTENYTVYFYEQDIEK